MSAQLGNSSFVPDREPLEVIAVTNGNPEVPAMMADGRGKNKEVSNPWEVGTPLLSA